MICKWCGGDPCYESATDCILAKTREDRDGLLRDLERAILVIKRASICKDTTCTECRSMTLHFLAEVRPTAATKETAEDRIECCGAPTVWAPDIRGTTVGGLNMMGAWWCEICGMTYLGDRSTPDEKWTLAGGGRSVETGVGRIRVDGADDAPALMARIVRLPELELLAEQRKVAKR